MTFVPPPSNVNVHYAERLGGLEAAILCNIVRVFHPLLTHAFSKRPPSRDGKASSDTDKIADLLSRIITGFSRALPDPGADEIYIDTLRTRILRCVRRGIPVAAQMFWSPKKHWQCGSESVVDLAELAALQTLLCLERAVRDVYPPGVVFRLDVEDLEFEFMEAYDTGIVQGQRTYVESLRSVIRALGLSDVFALQMVSDHAAGPEELGRWREQLVENHRVLSAYWRDSETRGFEGCASLATYRELRKLGWRGTLPPEMRRHYLNRIGTLAAASYETRVDMVVRNLAGILLHHQVGLLRGCDGVEPVRFSFVRPAASAPAELRAGRVDLRFVARKVCSRVQAAAPWATKGFVISRDGGTKVTFRGWHELARKHSQFVQGRLTVAGRAKTASIRADLLKAN